MLIGGLWHGARWKFVVWGGLHGTYLSANTAFNRSGLGRRAAALPKVLRAGLGWAVTFIGVMYAWLYFGIGRFDDAMTANRKIYEWLTSGDLWSWSVPWGLALLVAVVLVVDLVRRNAADLFPIELVGSGRALAFGGLTGGFFTVGLILLVATPAQQFIYFQF